MTKLTHTRPHARAARRDGSEGMTRWLLSAGIVGPVLFVLAFTIAGALRPGYSPVRDVVSDLGAGPGSWLQNANFAVFGVLLLAFAAGFRRASGAGTGKDAAARKPAADTASRTALTVSSPSGSTARWDRPPRVAASDAAAKESAARDATRAA